MSKYRILMRARAAAMDICGLDDLTRDVCSVSEDARGCVKQGYEGIESS